MDRTLSPSRDNIKSKEFIRFNGIVCYGDTTIRHADQDAVVLEFLDFFHTNKQADNNLKYLIFDSKFTT